MIIHHLNQKILILCLNIINNFKSLYESLYEFNDYKTDECKNAAIECIDKWLKIDVFQKLPYINELISTLTDEQEEMMNEVISKFCY